MENVWLAAAALTVAMAGFAQYRLTVMVAATVRRSRERPEATWITAARAAGGILASAILLAATATALLMWTFLYVVTSHPRPFGTHLPQTGAPSEAVRADNERRCADPLHAPDALSRRIAAGRRVRSAAHAR